MHKDVPSGEPETNDVPCEEQDDRDVPCEEQERASIEIDNGVREKLDQAKVSVLVLFFLPISLLPS